MRLHIALTVAAALAAGSANAQAVSHEEAGRVQSEMLVRVSNAVTAYARSIGMDSNYITYCRVEMDLIADGHPKDGNIPFGINYYDVTRETLNHTIAVREAFERSYLTLCLAEAKNALRAAAAR